MHEQVEHSSMRLAADAALEQVRAYHQRTKHSLQAYAKGPEALDWTAQPNPFRVYETAEFNWLPLVKLPAELSFAELISAQAPTRSFDLKTLSLLLRLSLGLAQWKQYGGDQWALRCNPSSGNLHPVEAYVVLVGWEGLKNGVYHYDCYLHALALRCEFLDQAAFEPLLLVGLTAIHWREAWKYGERAFRYSQLDIGHAIGGLAVAAAGLGWQIELVADGAEPQLTGLLGVARAEFAGVEAEHAECLLAVGPAAACAEAKLMWPALARAAACGRWVGTPNLLDPKPLYRWPVIDQVAAAAKLPLHTEPDWQSAGAAKVSLTSEMSAEQVILQRRSAQAYAAAYVLPHAEFWQLLDGLAENAFWPGPGAKQLHVIVAVHKVEGLTPGFYLLPRSADASTAVSALKGALGRWTDWQEVPHPSGSYSIYRITTANVQRAVGTLCCHQRIATDCALEIGFLAEFDALLAAYGAAAYRHMHWQAGLLAQRLYLAATAVGVGGTGIGCFFDDAWHELMGITDSRYQFVYHFAIGQPLHDSRLVGLSGYFHLKDRLWEQL